MIKQDSGVYACIAEDAVRYNLGEVRMGGGGGRHAKRHARRRVHSATRRHARRSRARQPTPPRAPRARRCAPGCAGAIGYQRRSPLPFTCAPPYLQVKEELQAAMGLNTEAKGSVAALIRSGYKTSTWFEDDTALEQSKEWRL